MLRYSFSSELGFAALKKKTVATPGLDKPCPKAGISALSILDYHLTYFSPFLISFNKSVRK